jgi:hypothetical protein
MDGVAPFGLVERGPTGAALKVVPAVSEPVGPRRQDLAAPTGADLLLTEPVHHVVVARPVAAQGGPDLRHDDVLGPMADVVLTARRQWVGLDRPFSAVCRHGVVRSSARRSPRSKRQEAPVW